VMTVMVLFAWAVLAEGSMRSSSSLLVSLFVCNSCRSGVKGEANWIGGQSVIGRIRGSSLVLIIFFL
jgi:hypothetical protein